MVPLLLCGQEQTSPPAFELASIRPHEGPLTRTKDFSSSGPRLRLEGYSAVMLVMEAYNLENYQVFLNTQVPWYTEKYFNILANAPGDTAPTKEQFRRMLRTLLTDRFQLKMHREMKDTPVYGLVTGKNGPKLKASLPDSPRVANTRVNGRNQNMDLSHCDMDCLAQELAIFVDRPVINKTALTGTYAIKLEATPFYRLNNPQPTDISVFDAVQDVFGLKLEKLTAPVEVLVIDSLEQPSAN